jgi:hypothetical protein
MALNWTHLPEDTPAGPRAGKPTTGAIVFGLLALGAGIWLSIQLNQANDLEASRTAFDGAPACTTKSNAPCRQTASAKITDRFLYPGCNFARTCGLFGGHPTCQIGVQVGADTYEVYVTSPSPCHTDYIGEHTNVVLYNGAVVSVGNNQTKDNPDWAAQTSSAFVWLAGFVTLFGLTGAIFLGAKAVLGYKARL